jgi:crotonobetainyl-CoA:carnitine CoA-transferase CaiB-like acyl-CoA transferase
VSGSGALSDVRVLDLTRLLPGGFCSLMLADLGADVVKVEDTGMGDYVRWAPPYYGGDEQQGPGTRSALYLALNRGKRAVRLDLKAEAGREAFLRLARDADVVLESFRPGVLDKLGCGYEALRDANPAIVYCAITGYGQHGPRADVAAHDLNYVAESGMLALTKGADGAPVLPAALVADIAGGTYPAVINILLALQQRARTGQGCRLDIAMCDHLFPFMYWALGNGFAAGRWPRPGDELVTGGSPRYRIYRTADDRFLAAAPLEQRFWDRFCALIGLEKHWRDDRRDPAATITHVAEIIRAWPAAHWEARFRGEDVCCALVRTLEEALADPHFRARGLFDHEVQAGERSIPAVPVPVAPEFRSLAPAGYPRLGEDDRLLRPEPDEAH